MIDYDDYRDPESLTSSYKGCTISIIGLAVCLLLALLFASCTTTKYIPVETVRTEYKTVTDSFIQKDSIFVKDSVLIESKGDTIHWHHWHIEYKDHATEKAKKDSFIKVDSIPVPYPVEKKLTKWQQVKIDYGGEAIILAIVVIFIVIWLIFKRIMLQR